MIRLEERDLSPDDSSDSGNILVLHQNNRRSHCLPSRLRPSMAITVHFRRLVEKRVESSPASLPCGDADDPGDIDALLEWTGIGVMHCEMFEGGEYGWTHRGDIGYVPCHT